VASRERGSGVEGTLGPGSLPEPTAFVESIGHSGPSANRQTPHRTPEDPPLRDPAAYHQTDHFRKRLYQQGRYVSVPIVEQAIVEGQLRWNNNDGWRFALVEDGIEYVIVVSDTETHSPVVVTGWTAVDDWEEALNSDQWTEEDIQTIQLRADLSAQRDEQVPDQIRPRIVSRPFKLGSHSIVTEAGSPAVTCVKCGRQFRSKSKLCQKRCR